jgi:hypothetical protein
VGFKQLEASYHVNAGDPGTKAVLCALAFHSCDTCGLAWPGVKLLVSETEFGATAVRKGLAAITASGLAAVFRFPHGGRGLSTEYVVLTHVRELSPAPCVDCGQRMKNPPRPGAFVAPNPPPRDAISGNPPGNPPRNVIKGTARVDTNSHSTAQQSGSASPPEVETDLSVRPTLDPSPASQIPADSQDALRALGLFTTPTDKSDPR